MVIEEARIYAGVTIPEPNRSSLSVLSPKLSMKYEETIGPYMGHACGLSLREFLQGSGKAKCSNSECPICHPQGPA